MDFVQIAVLGSLLATITILFIYIYLYLHCHEGCIGIWTISWCIQLVRYILFDLGLLNWKSPLFLIVFQCLILISSLLFVRGTHLFTQNSFKYSNWHYTAVIIAIAGIISFQFSPALTVQILPAFLISGFAYLWIGKSFLNLTGVGQVITGYSWILLGLLLLFFPFTNSDSAYTSFGYMLTGVCHLLIATGTLLIYSEKNRVSLTNKELQYRILENSIDIIFYFQIMPETKMKYISPSILAITGYSSKEYGTDPELFYRIIHPDDQSSFDNYISQEPECRQSPFIMRLLRNDNTPLWVEQKLLPVYNASGNLISLDSIIRDITIRKKLEHMSSMLDRMNLVGNMAATVAHEIRNPLTTVRGYLQILARKTEYERDKDKFKLVISEIDRANSIIGEYLSLSREKMTRLKICSLNVIVESVFPLIQADAVSSKIFSYLSLSPVPELLLDENEIRQLLLNLVRNGIEAMPNGGNLTIGTFTDDSSVILSVSDQGMGIPPHVLDKIGTPFITTKNKGTGLGLPICYQIAHRHNATIKIDTSNQGTTFLVYFSLSASNN
ncbi:MAG: sasA 14 [Firmicutes bacterium]|nr:sasA 14 [Bacillota bacterium]